MSHGHVKLSDFSSELIFHPKWAFYPIFPIPLSSSTTLQWPKPETWHIPYCSLSLTLPYPFYCVIFLMLFKSLNFSPLPLSPPQSRSPSLSDHPIASYMVSLRPFVFLSPLCPCSLHPLHLHAHGYCGLLSREEICEEVQSHLEENSADPEHGGMGECSSGWARSAPVAGRLLR